MRKCVAVKLTEQEYVEKKGIRCPFCLSDDLHQRSAATDAGYAWQDVRCNNCGAEWSDDYALTGYTTLNYPEKEV